MALGKQFTPEIMSSNSVPAGGPPLLIERAYCGPRTCFIHFPRAGQAGLA